MTIPYTQTATSAAQSTNIGMCVLATVLVGGALAVLSVPARLVNR